MPVPPLQNAIPLDDPFAQPAPVQFNRQQYHHLPPALAQAVQNLEAFPARGGHGHGDVPPVSINFYFYFFHILSIFILLRIIICL